HKEEIDLENLMAGVKNNPGQPPVVATNYSVGEETVE
ncbi:unnamed protein product, partial [marine sediment metagenome]